MLRMFSDLPAFRRDTLGFFYKKGVEASEPLVKLRLGFDPAYLVTDPNLIRDILRADEADIDKGRLIYKLREVLGKSSVTISGPAHRERRAVIHRQLAEGLAGDYVPQISAVIRAWIAAMATQDVVEAHQATSHVALRVISTVLFGRGSLTTGDENALVEAVKLAEDDLAEGMFRALPHSPWAYWRKKRKLRWARRIMTLVVDRTRSRATSISLLRAFETMGLEGETLRDETLLMILTGHHTTGTAAAWLLYHIAKDPQLAADLAEEARRLSDVNGELTPLAIRSASLSRAFAHEILRLYPSTYWMSRELKRDHVIAGERLKRGTSLIFSPWHLHRDPRFWSQPETLDLNRSHANKAFMPFGFGPRACTGLNVAILEMQLIALEFALSFESQPVSMAPPGPPKPSVTLVPPRIEIRIKARSPEAVRLDAIIAAE